MPRKFIPKLKSKAGIRSFKHKVIFISCIPSLARHKLTKEAINTGHILIIYQRRFPAGKFQDNFANTSFADSKISL